MLLPLLRSRAQGEVLAWIVRHPEAEFSLAEIARAVEVSQPTVMREVDRLVEAGLARQARRSRPRVWGEVSIRRVRPTVWDRDGGDPFKTSVTSRPMVTSIAADEAA
ncbi:hypothetical protein BN13_590005 [Nostocoides jenkinsii Ben 74]|uniref:HTH marR-type domain-containing protein n=1 Tax=Nostocoides jenkinsii Ben 74 TaxID=1193518 RepID=A0A077MBU6_9MICO|nr:hypothetical protein BN13_590005 [Tetrasphaera jenkinsii Ben 74]